MSLLAAVLANVLVLLLLVCVTVWITT